MSIGRLPDNAFLQEMAPVPHSVFFASLRFQAVLVNANGIADSCETGQGVLSIIVCAVQLGVQWKDHDFS